MQQLKLFPVRGFSDATLSEMGRIEQGIGPSYHKRLDPIEEYN